MPVEGNINRLINAIQSGADVKISDPDRTNYRYCEQVVLVDVSADTHVFCSHVSTALVNGGVIRNPPYRAYGMATTEGDAYLARASIYGGAAQGESTIVQGTRWYARVR